MTALEVLTVNATWMEETEPAQNADWSFGLSDIPSTSPTVSDVSHSPSNGEDMFGRLHGLCHNLYAALETLANAPATIEREITRLRGVMANLEEGCWDHTNSLATRFYESLQTAEAAWQHLAACLEDGDVNHLETASALGCEAENVMDQVDHEVDEAKESCPLDL